MMVGNRRVEEVVDPNLELKPTNRALKCALLVALRCVDPDSAKRPRMSQVVQMLEADEFPYHEVLFQFQLLNVLLIFQFLHGFFSVRCLKFFLSFETSS